jgi:STE24 endopeptidase
MNAFTWTFLIALFAGLALQLWLAARQAAHILAHATRVPAAFADRISLEQHQKAASYSLAQLGIERWDLVLAAIVLLGWTLAGGLNWLDQGIAALGLPTLWGGVAAA